MPYIRRTRVVRLGPWFPGENHLGTLLPPITPDCPFSTSEHKLTSSLSHKMLRKNQSLWKRNCMKQRIVMSPVSTGTQLQISPWHACTRWSTPARYLYGRLQSSTAGGMGRRSRRRTRTRGPPATSSRGSATTCSRSPSRGNTFACSQCSPGCDTWKDLSHNLSVCTRLTNQFGRKTFGNISQRSWPTHISAAHYTAVLSWWMI